MKKNKKYTAFNQGLFSVFDAQSMPYKKDQDFAHFALTDALITYAGAHERPLIHFWQTDPLVILGMMDTKIGHFQQALPVFYKYHHRVIVRNSGGLAVVSDPGVLNVSLIYPSKEERLTIDMGYEYMLDFIRETFYPIYPYEIKAYEITNSYCFGDYDLSIEGRKIAGISQRRIKNGVAIMLYISVNGDQKKRAEMLKEFYHIGLDGTEPSGRYPDIHPEVMTTLEDAYDTHLSVAEVKSNMLRHFDWQEGSYEEEMDRYYSKALEKMKRRNQRVFGEDFVLF